MAKTRGPYQRPDSELWWISYTDASGRRVRESTRTTDKEAAKRLLKDKEGRAARGEVMLSRVDRVTCDEARADLAPTTPPARPATLVKPRPG